MTTPPRLDGAPGHRWQPRADGRFVCIWVARRDIVKKGYSPKTQRIWPPTAEPDAVLDEGARFYIQSECQRLQDDMHSFIKGRGENKPPKFDGRLETLIECYKTDPDSDYLSLRHKSRKTYDSHLRMVVQTVGQRLLAEVKGRDLKRWFRNWSEDGKHIPRAHYRMTCLRLVIGFGSAMLEDENCKRLRLILSDLEFEQGRPREYVITAEQVIKLRQGAHAAGDRSIALAQSFQFDVMLRQKDTIGAWVPLAEPGMSAIVHRGLKWLYGLDWSEVSDGFVLKHRLSKSLRGKDAINDQKAGKTKTFNLALYPMVMEDLALIAGCPVPELRRDMFPASGPVIVNKETGQPFTETSYRTRWRTYATLAGIPKSIQNRDSRAGGATEAEELGLDTEKVRKALGHSKPETTRIYTRGDDAVTAQVAVFRSEKRPANKLTNK